MTIEALGFIQPGVELEAVAGLKPTGEAGSFSSWLDAQAVELNTTLNNSESLLQDFAMGKADNLHHLMLEMEKARTAFQLTLQVRNKVLEGYQEIMRMQV